MTVEKLFNILNISEEIVNNFEISNITCDTRKIEENTLFFLFDKKYIDKLINSKAKIVITNLDITLNDKNIIFIEDLIECYSKCLKIFYLNYNPYIIGITGTCGKTTTSTLIYRTIKDTNKSVLLLCSNGIYSFFNKQELVYETFNTTPNLETIYNYISSNTFDYIIIEVSSQGIANNRIYGIAFDLCVFLNFSQDHLDYHLTLDNYLNTKLKLFNQIKEDGKGVINYDFLYKDKISNLLIDKFTFGIDNGDFKISIIEVGLQQMKLKIEDKCISTYFTGLYNAENIAASYAVIKLLDIKLKHLYRVLQQYNVIDGRYEIINYLNNNIIIDFAHTEKEFEVILSHLHKNKLNKLYVIAGCGGNRDKHKRSILGKLCSIYSDFTILTEDNSRDEILDNIIIDIESGFLNNNHISILDRFDAIKYGINLLDENDILLILGMGKEKNYLMIDSYYSDKMIVEKIIEEV